MLALDLIREARLTSLGDSSLIGKKVKFKEKYREFPVHKENFTIVGFQRDWKGTRCIRVVSDNDPFKFGMVAHFHELEFYMTPRKINSFSCEKEQP